MNLHVFGTFAQVRDVTVTYYSHIHFRFLVGRRPYFWNQPASLSLDLNFRSDALEIRKKITMHCFSVRRFLHDSPTSRQC